MVLPRRDLAYVSCATATPGSSLTESGRSEAEQRQDTAPPWAELAEDAGRPNQRLRQSVRPVVTAVHELFQHGTPAQQEQARAI